MDTLLGDYRTGAAQDAETAGAITAALLASYTSSQVDALLGDYRTATLLAYRTGPDQDVFTTNQITSALVAYRSAADQDTATALSIAAALLSYYTIAQVDGLLAGKLGVTEAASVPDDGGPDKAVAAIGEQILGPTDVSLSNWTVRPSSGCSVVLATHKLQSCTLARTSRRRACPTRRQERWTSTASRSWTQPWKAEEDTAASALLPKHEFLNGGDDVTLATLGEVLLEPTLTTLGNFLVRSNSQSSVREASSWRATP